MEQLPNGNKLGSPCQRYPTPGLGYQGWVSGNALPDLLPSGFQICPEKQRNPPAGTNLQTTGSTSRHAYETSPKTGKTPAQSTVPSMKTLLFVSGMQSI